MSESGPDTPRVGPSAPHSTASESREHRRAPARASRTAALMAVQRGLESTRPRRTRLFTDPLAPLFLSRPWRLALVASRLGPVRLVIEATYDRVGGPGPRASAIARTKLIDEWIDQLAPSVEQVVVLGAGYDIRPYRLDCLAPRCVFEVDRPDTQAAKRAALTRASVERAGIVFVPVDFETDDLADALTRAGFAHDRPALFIWEGVTQYLSAESVDHTLAVIHDLAARGSHLIFTYVDVAVIGGGATRFPEAAKWLRGVATRGEPWIFGIDPGQAREFLAVRGYHLEEDVSAADAGARYFTPLGRREWGSGLYRIAVTVVDSTIEAS